MGGLLPPRFLINNYFDSKENTILSLKRQIFANSNLLSLQDGPGLYLRDILADREPAQELLDVRARRQALGREVVKNCNCDKLF